jgi:hypothetical protein
MTLDQAAIFFTASILTMLGFIVVCAGMVAINNMLAKFWKPVKLFTPDSFQINPNRIGRFATNEELANITPELKNPNK